MRYKRMLSGTSEDIDVDMKTTIKFLYSKFGAVSHNHPFLRNLVILGGKTWWVMPTTSSNKVELCYGQECTLRSLMYHVDKLDAGILIFRQFADNQLCIYLLENMDKLERCIVSNSDINWEAIDNIKSLSENGIMVGDELMGFKTLRRLRHDIINPVPEFSRTA